MTRIPPCIAVPTATIAVVAALVAFALLYGRARSDTNDVHWTYPLVVVDPVGEDWRLSTGTRGELILDGRCLYVAPVDGGPDQLLVFVWPEVAWDPLGNRVRVDDQVVSIGDEVVLHAVEIGDMWLDHPAVTVAVPPDAACDVRYAWSVWGVTVPDENPLR